MVYELKSTNCCTLGISSSEFATSSLANKGNNTIIYSAPSSTTEQFVYALEQRVDLKPRVSYSVRSVSTRGNFTGQDQQEVGAATANPP